MELIGIILVSGSTGFVVGVMIACTIVTRDTPSDDFIEYRRRMRGGGYQPTVDNLDDNNPPHEGG